MFYLLVPSKWKLRLLVLDCIIIAITLVQFANHFDSMTKQPLQAQTNASIPTGQDGTISALNNEDIARIFDETSKNIESNTTH